MVVTKEGSFFYITGEHAFMDSYTGHGIGFRMVEYPGNIWYAYGYCAQEGNLIYVTDK